MGKLIVYTSSAGSGKTFTLAKEYLKTVLKNPNDFKNILAVTFTNKATDEMKVRIIDYLRHFAGRTKLPDGEDMKKDLLDSGVTLNEIGNSDIVLKNLLHNYTNFYVMTIDSFFSQVVKSFAKELNLPSGFDYEIDENIVLEKIIGDIWQESSTDDELLMYLVDMMRSRFDDGGNFNIDNDLERIAKEIFKDRFWEMFSTQEKADSVFPGKDFKKNLKNLRDDCSNFIKKFDSEYKKLAADACDYYHSLGLTVDDFFQKSNGIYSKLEKIKRGDVKKFNSYYIKGIMEGVLSGTKSGHEHIINSNKDEIIRYAKSVYDYYKNNIKVYLNYKTVSKNLMLTGLFADLYKNLQAYKDKNSVLLISDVAKIIRQYVGENNEFTPFIFEKFGSNFKYILIDEFQDTSSFQWHNLRPLIVNSISENHNSMVVGDAKQSIYRFRNGNMELLVKGIYNDINRNNITDIVLDTNHRSLKNIVEFNNSFFEKIIEKVKVNLSDGSENNKEIFEKAYNDVRQKSKYDESAGIVNITKIAYSKNKSEFQERAMKRLIDILKELDKKLISNHKYKRSDISILLRDNKEASEIAETLIKEGYNVVSASSSLLIKSPKVKLIIGILKLIADRRNNIAKLEAEYHYKKKVMECDKCEDLIFKLSENKEDKYKFDVEMPAEFFREGNEGQLNTKLYDLNILELVEYITDIFGLNKNPDMFLFEFINVVKDFTAKFAGDLQSFLFWWEENSLKLEIETAVNEDAIQIQTIHKMKGLQNKIIIIPYATWSVKPQANGNLLTTSKKEPFNKIPFLLLKNIKELAETDFSNDYLNELDKTLIDNINLLYVAFTRPKEMLYVITQDISNNQKTSGRDDENGTDTPSDISFYIVNSLHGLEFETKSETSEIYQVGDFGFAENKIVSDEKVINVNEFEELIYNDWYKKVVIKPKNHFIRPWEDKYEDVSYGNVFHDIMSEIIYKEDAEDVLNDAKRNGLLDGEKFDKLKMEVTNLLNNKTVSAWFGNDWQVLTERDILTKEGKTYRPDRVIYKGNVAIVIDYKTGGEKKEYKEQINNYAELLMQSGFEDVSKYLLYINQDKNKIVEVK